MNNEVIMKDHLGNELRLGDMVAVINGVGRFAEVYIGYISRYTKASVFVRYEDKIEEYETYISRDKPWRIIKL